MLGGAQYTTDESTFQEAGGVYSKFRFQALGLPRKSPA